MTKTCFEYGRCTNSVSPNSVRYTVLRRAAHLRFRHAELGGDVGDVDEGREETCNIQHVLNWGNRTCLHIGYMRA